MGKGLGLTRESQGVHYAFAAGTGVLVFIDMVARILLGARKLIPDEERLNEKFELILYASFLNRDDAIALKLMEMMHEDLTVPFKLKLRLSQPEKYAKKEPRWDKDFLKKEIPNTAQKIWVCGPPLMNEKFDRDLEDICKDKGINFLT